MDFTREPIIETIITPKDGCKLVVRNSKAAGQEEYFVEALEIISFGHALFFRSLERPKSFLVPVSDYEVVEVRETRMVLKNLSSDRSIKIGGGREVSSKGARDIEKAEVVQAQEEAAPVSEQEGAAETTEGRSEIRLDKKRDRRRHYRKRKNGKDEPAKEDVAPEILNVPALEEGGKVDIPAPGEGLKEEVQGQVSQPSSSLLSSLLQPPPTLISETISRYRENALFKNAFFLTEEEQYQPHNKVNELLNEDDDYSSVLQEPVYDTEEQSAEGQSSEEEIKNESNPEEFNESSSTVFVESEDFSYRLSEEESLKEDEQIEKEEEISLPLFAEESFNDIHHGDYQEEIPSSADVENPEFVESNGIDENKPLNE